MTIRNGLASLLRPEDSVLVLIDHQPYQLANLNSHDPHMVVNAGAEERRLIREGTTPEWRTKGHDDACAEEFAAQMRPTTQTSR